MVGEDAYGAGSDNGTSTTATNHQACFIFRMINEDIYRLHLFVTFISTLGFIDRVGCSDVPWIVKTVRQT